MTAHSSPMCRLFRWTAQELLADDCPFQSYVWSLIPQVQGDIVPVTCIDTTEYGHTIVVQNQEKGNRTIDCHNRITLDTFHPCNNFPHPTTALFNIFLLQPHACSDDSKASMPCSGAPNSVVIRTSGH